MYTLIRLFGRQVMNNVDILFLFYIYTVGNRILWFCISWLFLAIHIFILVAMARRSH